MAGTQPVSQDRCSMRPSASLSRSTDALATGEASRAAPTRAITMDSASGLFELAVGPGRRLDRMEDVLEPARKVSARLGLDHAESLPADGRAERCTDGDVTTGPEILGRRVEPQVAVERHPQGGVGILPRVAATVHDARRRQGAANPPAKRQDRLERCEAA